MTPPWQNPTGLKIDTPMTEVMLTAVPSQSITKLPDFHNLMEQRRRRFRRLIRNWQGGWIAASLWVWILSGWLDPAGAFLLWWWMMPPLLACGALMLWVLLPEWVKDEQALQERIESLLRQDSGVPVPWRMTGILRGYGPLIAIDHPHGAIQRLALRRLGSRHVLPERGLAYFWQRPRHREVLVSVRDELFWGQPVAVAHGRRQTWLAILFSALALGLMAWGMNYFAVTQYREQQRLNADLLLAQASLNWPIARALIVESSLESVRLPAGKSTDQGYEARIGYQFILNDQMYHGQRRFFCAKPLRSQDMALDWLARYPMGSRHSVAYSPEAPSTNSLEPGHVAECLSALELNRYDFWGSAGLAVLLWLLPILVVRDILRARPMR